MKSKTRSRVLASLMALLMVVGLIPTNLLGGVVAFAESTTYTFDPSAEASITGAEKKATIADGTTFADGFFTLVGAATRANSSVYSLELAKAQTGSLQFTSDGVTKVTFTVSSTGSSNTTTGITLTDADGATYAESTGQSEVKGSDGVEFTYENLPAGTYSFNTTESARGMRILSAVVEVEAASTEPVTNTFDPAEEAAITGAEKKATIADGTTFTNGYFTLEGSATRANSSVYSLELAKAQTGSLVFTTTGTAKAAFTVSSTGSSNTTTGITLTDADGNTYAESTGQSEVKGSDGVEFTYENLPAGTYKFNTTESARGMRVLKAVVEEQSGAASGPKERLDWDKVANPTVNSVVKNSDGSLDIDVTGNVGYDGADSARLFMYQDGFEVSSVQVTKDGVYTLTPTTEGTFTFKVIISRSECTDKESEVYTFDGYTLPLAKPTITWLNNLGNGSVYVDWNNVEADQYTVSYKSEADAEYVEAAQTTTGNYTLTGLIDGSKYDVKVSATKDGLTSSDVASITVGDAEQKWYVAAIGSATSGKITVDGTEYPVTTASGVTEVPSVVNTDKVIKIDAAENGKIADSEDGFFFYYTKIDPNTENFKLTATFTVVDTSSTPDNQTGYGIYATDVAGYGSKDNKYFNSVSVGQFKMYLNGYHAHGARLVTGYESYDTSNTNGVVRSLDNTNVIGPVNTDDTVNVGDSFTYTLEKTDEGYVASMTGGSSYTFEGATSLMQQEDGSICVGVMAARKVGVEISDITFEKSEGTASGSSAATITPSFKVISASTSNTTDYEFIGFSNVNGWLDVYDPSGTLIYADYIEADKNIKVPVTLTNVGGYNGIRYAFAVDKEIPNLESTGEISSTVNVLLQQWGNEGETIYVSPNGNSSAAGTMEDPLALETALKYAQPGQTILMLDGTYYPTEDYVIPRGVDGTADNMITLAPLNEVGSVIIDGSAMEASSSLLTIVGDYWHVYGIEFQNGLGKGVSVCGSNNIVERCTIHDVQNTGLQISRYSGEPNDNGLWPANNLIKYCEAYDCCDPGRNDADGFAAKLTCGEGNKFYGCISHNNIDDGWDLYAKSTTGPIGAVTIENCVAYSNGFLTTDDPATVAFGEGNGFKLGGENMPGAHKLINSITYNNAGKGVTSNSGPNCEVYNVTAYNNSLKGSTYNVSLYTKASNSKEWKLDGMLSIAENGTTAAELGSSNGVIYSLRSATNYLFDGTKSTNTTGVTATSAWFVSTDISVRPTITDNGIDMHGLLELTSDAPSDTGARLTLSSFSGQEAVKPTATATTVSEKKTMQILGFTAVALGSSTGVKTGDTAPVMPLVFMMIVSAAICGVCVFRRKRA